MCWVALDRAARLADQLRAGDRVQRWCRERDRIREAILAVHGSVGCLATSGPGGIHVLNGYSGTSPKRSATSG